MIKGLKIFAYVWIYTVSAIMVVSYGWIFWNQGFGAVQELLNPWGAPWGTSYLIHFVVTVVSFSPGFAAHIWAEKLQEKQNLSINKPGD